MSKHSAISRQPSVQKRQREIGLMVLARLVEQLRCHECCYYQHFHGVQADS